MNPRIPFFVLFLIAMLSPLAMRAAADRQTIELSGTGWKLWRDAGAAWENDELFLPPADLTRVPVSPPTGGWEELDSADAKSVTVPGTAEEYLGDGSGPAAAVKGVTWWTRTFHAPADIRQRKVRLLFDSVRLRAEVYVNRKLAAYDLVGNTPFEADLTGLLSPESNNQLAVRITNPGGNFDWRDVVAFDWGKYKIPLSHGFGGITGGVRLVVSEPVYVDDLYVQNTPAKSTVNVIATIQNATAREAMENVELSVREKSPGGPIVFERHISGVKLDPGRTMLTYPVNVPDAKLWDIKSPNLYECAFRIAESGDNGDSTSRTFGFRWFSPEGVGSDAMFRLNGKRVVLRTAISWGFWPVTGLFPSPELAEKQIRTARAYGLNMLNFHRCIGNPVVLDKADELGLMYFEEPGGYVSGAGDPFAQALCREKLLRMVRRDRSHPSLIIYNMINEQWDNFGALTDETLFYIHKRDLQDAHALDPSRTIVYTSAWAGRSGDPDIDRAKMHMRPFDTAIHMNGWWDFHRAAGPETWKQDFYKGPRNHYGLTKDQGEIVYWGEEGAISAPPRLELIKADIDAAPRKGWDSQVYLDWYKAFDDYLTANRLRGAFPTVDDLCRAMGVVSIEHQGRKIEDTRICDLNDGYAINGWESELIDNHSGVVDVYRNPKADPAILGYYNQPLYIAVKPRRQITLFPGSVVVDFYLVNESDLQGPHTLQVRVTARDGHETFNKDFPVEVRGGDVFSQMAAEGVAIPVDYLDGMTTVTGRLVDAQGTVKASGHDEVLGVDWKKASIRGNGAVYESGSAVRDFLKEKKGLDVAAFDDTQPKLDWLVVAKAALPKPSPIPAGDKIGPEQVLDRARRDGTTILIVDRADTWLDALGKAAGVPPGKSFAIGLTWLGGQYFVKDHPLFKDLPVNQGLIWPYQGVVGGKRIALKLNGGELVAGAWQSWPMNLGSAVSILPLGKGRVILSTLDIAGQLANPDSAAEVARKLLCNYLAFAGEK